MKKLHVSDALEIVERDDIGKCESCTDLAEDGEKYCRHCKDYWENDVPLFTEYDFERDWLLESEESS